MSTRFIKLNDDWNAEPNSPAPAVAPSGNDVVLEFRLNPFQFTQFSEGDCGRLVFRNCWRYRLGGTNDEGWYLGQCRFSKVAPAWGEFYEVLARTCCGNGDWPPAIEAQGGELGFAFAARLRLE
jgi:hypothetical protein